MFGKNEVRGPRGDGDYLVKEIWHTIQGEGPYAGFPAIFVRFSDCNLRCFFCDTDFTGGTAYDLESLMLAIKRAMTAANCSLVVLTGGEPMLQDLRSLIMALPDARFQIETAGTVWPKFLDDLFDPHWIGRPSIKLVCSPKTIGIHSKIIEHCLDWKYIVREGEQSLMDGLPTRSTQEPGRPQQLYRARRGVIYVQPCDEGDDAEGLAKTARNIQLATRICLTFGYRLSLQLHKLVGVA
jgi:7-carboxy-7-deazaguanine synthase